MVTRKSLSPLKLVQATSSMGTAEAEPKQQSFQVAHGNAVDQPSDFDGLFELALTAYRRIGKSLESAWQLQTNNPEQQLRVSILAMLVYSFRYADYYDSTQWIKRFDEALPSAQTANEPDTLTFWCDVGRMARAQVTGRASDEVFDIAIGHVRNESCPNANAWLLMAGLCVAEANSRQQPATASALMEMVSAHPWYENAAPLLRIRWHFVSGYGYFLGQRHAQALTQWQISDELIDEFGLALARQDTRHDDALDSLKVLVRVSKARLALDTNDIETANRELDIARKDIGKCVAYARVLFHHLCSRSALLLGKLIDAQYHLDTAREVLRLEYQDPGYVPVVLTEYLQLLFAQHNWGDAVKVADEFKPHFERHGLHYGEFLRQAALTRLWAENQAQHGSHEPFLSSLQAAMDLAVKHKYVAMMRSVPEFASWLCAKALEHEVHAEFAKEVVSSRNLPTPSRAPRQWPWAVWLDMLGPFTITLEGQRLALTGKVAQKPLELIKLLACTKRYTLSLDSAAMQLWPDTEELPAARKNLETTISRARKLIGETHIKVGEGRVQLAGDKVGCDLQYVLDTCAEAESLGQRKVTLAQLNQTASLLIELYEGELLQADEESLWLSSARQYLRNAYVRATLAIAGALQNHDMQSDVVTKLLENAISREPLAEQLYTKLMEHYIAQGRNAEALHTYRRCKQYLSVVLGLPPSKATEALRSKILEN
jgi:DNA-binding SARP family transcriptional activator